MRFLRCSIELHNLVYTCQARCEAGLGEAYCSSLPRLARIHGNMWQRLSLDTIDV